MEISAIVVFCNKLCGAAVERKVSQGCILKNYLGLGELESILRAFSISLFLLSMERISEDVFSVLQKILCYNQIGHFSFITMYFQHLQKLKSI